jgi:hypothetical protein
MNNLRINSKCEGNTTLLLASCTVMSDVTLKVGDLLTQNCTIVTVVKICV